MSPDFWYGLSKPVPQGDFTKGADGALRCSAMERRD